MKKKIKKIITRTPRGFAALMSAIIISAVLLMLVASTSMSSFYARANTMRAEFKRISLGHAESCMNVALLKVAQDFNYDLSADPLYGPLPHNLSKNGVRVEVGADDCYIIEVTLSTEDPVTHKKSAIALVQAEFRGSFSNIKTSFTVQSPHVGAATPLTNINISSWQEISILISP